MAVTSTPVFPQAPQAKHCQITNGSGTAVVTLYAGGANGSKVAGILATSTDTSARDISLALTDGTNSYVFGTVSVAATAGTVSTVIGQNLLDPSKVPGLPLDSDGNPYIHIPNGWTLQVNAVVTLTSAKVVNVTAFGADF